MKVQVCKQLVDRFGEPMTVDLTERDPRTGEPKGRERIYDVTIGYLIADLMWGADPGKKELTGRENLERYEIAKRVSDAEKRLTLCDLTPQERTLILELAEKRWAPGVYGQLEEALRDKPEGEA